MDTSTYVQSEWADFEKNGSELAPLVDEFLHRKPVAVLDVGCGGGQELIPFSDCVRIGIDIDAEKQIEGRRLFGLTGRTAPHFSVATGESLPFADNSFDIIICRIALPYMDNVRTLSEISRALKPNGVLLLKFHHLRFYLRQLKRAIIDLNARSAFHAIRVIVCGLIFWFSGTQPQIKVGNKISQEVFQVGGSMRKLVRRSGLVPVGLFNKWQVGPTIAAIKPQC